MLTGIEEKIVERLELYLTGNERVSIDEAHATLAVPAVDVIVGGGQFQKVSQHYKLEATVYVVVTFQHLRSVRDRRKGVYPILEAIVALLVGNSPGLAISPLIPRRLDNITEKKEAEDGKIVFQMEFETGFVIEKRSDEEVADLITVGLDYYLTPGDDTADASDRTTLIES